MCAEKDAVRRWALVLGFSAISCGQPMADPDSEIIEERDPPTAFEGPPPARRGEPLQTDLLEYEASKEAAPAGAWDYGFRVIARFANETSDSLFLENCTTARRPAYSIVPSSDDDEVESAFNPIWACVGHNGQLAVEPGGARVDTFDIVGPWVRDTRTNEADGFFEGWWRIAYVVRTDRGGRAPPVADSMSVSNVFEIRLAR